MNFESVREVLIKKGYEVSYFDTKEEAAEYLNREIDQVTVGFGGSVTLEEMGLYERLSGHNTVYWHQRIPEGMTSKEVREAACRTQIYCCSVNALAETGEIINIDGTGNRVASMFYGHEKLYLIAGENKIAKDYESALWRARNIASPLNAKRLGRKTPCVAGGRCFDCQSPERICRGLSVLWEPLFGTKMEIVLIHENLGY